LPIVYSTILLYLLITALFTHYDTRSKDSLHLGSICSDFGRRALKITANQSAIRDNLTDSLTASLCKLESYL